MTFTDEQKALIDHDDTLKQIHITFPNHEIEDIENDRIYQESMMLEESLIDQDDIVFGKCNSARFTIKVADFAENIDGAEMDVSITMSNDTLGLVMEFPLGKYYVYKTERTADRRHRIITAQDFMVLFDVDISEWYNNTLFPSEDTKRHISEILFLLCSYIGVEYDREFDYLIHSDLYVGKSIQPTQLSGRELLQRICELNACFGHFDYDGVLKFITIENPELYPTGENAEYISLYKSCEYEDYDVKPINSVQIRLEDDDIGVTAVQESAEVINRYIITGNFILSSLEKEQMQIAADNLLFYMQSLTYRPNTTIMQGGLHLQLGKKYNLNTSQESFQSYVLKRTLSGIQALVSTIEANGSEWLSETSNNITSQLSTLSGKTSKLKRDFESLESTFTNYSEQIESKITQTAEEINLKVNRGDVSSELSLEDGKVEIKGNRIKIESDNFILNEDGSISCSDVTITGGKISIETSEDLLPVIETYYGEKIRMQVMPNEIYSYSNGEYISMKSEAIEAWTQTEAGGARTYRYRLDEWDCECESNGYSFSNAYEQLANKVNKTDTIAIAHGGTGATTAANARANLGISGYIILNVQRVNVTTGSTISSGATSSITTTWTSVSGASGYIIALNTGGNSYGRILPTSSYVTTNSVSVNCTNDSSSSHTITGYLTVIAIKKI